MIATRYTGAIAGLLAVALAPTVAHTYVNAGTNDGRSVAALPAALAGMPSKRTARSAAWVGATFDSAEWVERVYRAGDGRRILLFAARTYDAKRVYHHPELALLYGRNARRIGMHTLRDRPDVPVHLIETSSREGKGVGGYVLMYGSVFVANPLTFQLRTALRAVFTPRPLMTLILVHDPVGAVDSAREFEASAAGRLLLHAITAFEQHQVAATR